MQCPQCGNEAEPQQKFCAVCGSSLQPPVTITAPLVADPPNGEPSPTNAPPVGVTTGNFIPYQSSAEAALTTSRTSSRIPFALVVGIALLVIVVTLIAVALAVTASQGGGAPGPLAGSPTTTAPTDSISLLNRSADAMKGVNTLHYRSEAGFYAPAGDGSSLGSSTPLSMTIDGDVALPDRYTMNTDAAALGQFIVIGENTWNRNNEGKWQRRSTAGVGLGPVNPLAVANYMQYYKPGTPEQISSETKDGVILHRVRFDVDTERMAQDAGEQSVQGLMEQSRITTDVWIRDGDNLLDSISLAVDMSNGTGVILRSFFSNYNEEVVIKPPDGVTP
ncbi:MAG: hypothetical protein ABIO92_04440 [Chloroflexia bacterium]